MENYESKDNDGQARSPWETTDFPSFNNNEKENEDNGITQETIDYFVNNPKEIDKLAQEIVAARKDAKEGAAWDKEKRAYIGEDGLPRDWAHLVGHLKNNPETIKTAIETLQSLQSNDTAGDIEPTTDDAETDNIEAGAEETVEEEKTPEDIAEEKALTASDENESINPIDRPNEELAERGKSPSEALALKKAKEYIDRARNTTHGLGIPRKIAKELQENFDEIMEISSDGVKGYYDKHFDSAKRERDKKEKEIKELKQQLYEISGFAFPWSKKAREKRELGKKLDEARGKYDELVDFTKSERDYLSSLPEEDQKTIYYTDMMMAQAISAERRDIDGCDAEIAKLDALEQELKKPAERRNQKVVAEAHIDSENDDIIRELIAERRKMLEERKRDIRAVFTKAFPDFTAPEEDAA